MPIDILVTDVTEMAQDFCVAGYCAQYNRMIRPLPGGQNWSSLQITQLNLMPGATLRVDLAGHHNGRYPHSTEDSPVVPATVQCFATNFSDWTGPQRPPIEENIQDGFLRNVQWNSEWQGVRQAAWVAENTNCPSLIAIEVGKGRIFFKEPFPGKLRAEIDDGQNSYEISVSSMRLKLAFRRGGTPAAMAELPNRSNYHLRIGLARGIGVPAKCYLMLNGAL